MTEADRWLSAAEAAVHLGMVGRDGGVKVRSFLALADVPGFPEPLRIGKLRSWRRSELDAWALEQRRLRPV